MEDWLSKPIDGWRLLDAVERAVHGSNNGQRARVLHVEDDPDIRRLVASLCQDVAEYDHAASVREAREKPARGRYRLVILDLALPDGSGEPCWPTSRRTSIRRACWCSRSASCRRSRRTGCRHRW